MQTIFRSLVTISLTVMVLTGLQHPAEARSATTANLTIYASVDTDWIAKLATEFEKETGIHVAWIRESTGIILQRLKAEATHPRADLWFGGTWDGHANAAEAGLLAPFTPKLEASLVPAFQNPIKNGLSTGVYGGVIGFGINAPLLKQLGKAVPTSWADLLSSTYKGLIAMPNPNTSGTGYTIVSTLLKLKGEQAGFEYMKKLHANMAQYTQSGNGPAMLVGKGEIGIAIFFLYDSVRQRVMGFPLTEVLPAEGTGYEIGTMSLVKGAPNAEMSKRFMDWALEPRVQAFAAQVKSYQIPSNSKTPLDPNIIPFQRAKLLELDVHGMAKVRDRILQRWNTEVFTAAK